MEKKVNLTIFFNYRSYSPKIKLLLEDVFYKKMHDEKLSSSDAMQQVMQFCNDVDFIEYENLEENLVLSRFDKNQKKIILNRESIEKLLDEHKDLDEDALLKNIFGRQVQNILTLTDQTVFDVTFEDILNKNGYVTPRTLVDLSNEEGNLNSDSIINDVVGANKYQVKQKNDNNTFVNNNFSENIDYDEVGRDSEHSKDSFGSFIPDSSNNIVNQYEKRNNDNYNNSVKNSDSYSDFDYDVVDCVRRKDDFISSGSFSDFVSKSQSDVDYTLEDEENYGDLKKHKKGKNSKHFFKEMKNKVSSLKDKVFSKKDEFDDYYDDYENEKSSNEKSDSYLESGNKSEVKSEKYNVQFNDKKTNYYEDEDKNSKKESINDQTSGYNSATIVDNFDYSTTNDIDVNSKFDTIIEAIMKEKSNEQYESKFNTSTFETIKDENSYNDNLKEDKDSSKNDSIYDSFAEELETVESIRRRRRGK